MIFLHAKDSHYYDGLNQKKRVENGCAISGYKIEIKSTTKIVSVLSEKKAQEILYDIETRGHQEDIIIISPYNLEELKYPKAFFTVITLKNHYGLLTKSEKEVGITEAQKLETEIGLIVEEPTMTFEDMGGTAQMIKDEFAKVQLKKALGEPTRAIFLTGIMGTGKSMFARCLAGETKRLLVSLNLAQLMHADNPIVSFDMIFDFLKSQNEKYVLWIDEIEKMFTDSETSSHIRNKLLTALNDLGISIEIDCYVVITANRADEILSKSPEMLRGGRVEPNMKFFMNFLQSKTAKDIFSLYINKYNKNAKMKVADIVKFVLYNDFDKQHKFYKLVEPIIEKSKKILQFPKIESAPIASQKHSELFFEELQKLPEAKPIIEKLSNMLQLDYDIDLFMNMVYQTEFSDEPIHSNFAYVPAEIKEIVTQMFIEKAINPNKNQKEVFKGLISANMPIGESGKEGVKKILGNKDLFIEIS